MSTTLMDNPAVKSRIDEYLSPRTENDIDLITEVRKLLITYGLKEKLKDCYDSNRFIIEAANKSSNVQRYLLNNYWVQQLMFAEKPTTDERFCLVPDGDVKDWLRLFEQKVLPFVVDNNLPKVI